MNKFAVIIISIFLLGSQIIEAQVRKDIPSVKIDSSKVLKNIVKIDSLIIKDSTITVKKDSLIPLNIKGYYLNDNYQIGLKKEDINKSDYRYSGNIFSNLPFGFLQDLGSLGQPSEVMLYGLGFGKISFLSGGSPLNNRLLNSYDLNFFQSESIDSLEILPITKGFIYSLNNNSIAVNFITQDKIEDTTYSRIRYSQGGDSEGFIDGMLNYHLFPKIKLAFHFTNSSIDSRYANSEYSGWKVSTKLKYMPSNKINVIGEYRYLKSTAGLNGGVNLKKIKENNPASEVNKILYDPFLAVVKYGEQLKDSPRYQKTSAHDFRVNILAHLIENMPSNINLYYQFNQVEFRQNEKKDLANLPFIFHNNTFYSAGGIFRQLVKLKWMNADLIGTYDQTKYDSPLLKYSDTKHTVSVAGSVNFLLDNEKIVPSFFAKYMNYSGISFEGIGAGLNIVVSNKLQSSISASRFSKPYSILEEQFLTTNINKQNITTAQAMLKYNNAFISGSVGYFYYNNDGSPFPVIDEYTDTLDISEIGFYQTEKNIRQGINLNSNISFSNILVSINSSYFFGSNNSSSIPEFTFTGGVYYVDTLFKSNLKLKTGITMYFTGKQNYFQYDFEKSSSVEFYKPFGSNSIQPLSSAFTNSAIQLDYFMAGQIKDAAIIYFVFENILDTQYYIVPYSPKQSRGIRVGVSWELYD